MNKSNCVLANFEDIYRECSQGKEKFKAGEINELQFSNLIKLLTLVGNKEFKDAQPVYQNSQDRIYLGIYFYADLDSTTINVYDLYALEKTSPNGDIALYVRYGNKDSEYYSCLSSALRNCECIDNVEITLYKECLNRYNSRIVSK